MLVEGQVTEIWLGLKSGARFSPGLLAVPDCQSCVRGRGGASSRAGSGVGVAAAGRPVDAASPGAFCVFGVQF